MNIYLLLSVSEDPFADYQPPDNHLINKAGYLFYKM